MVLLERFAVQFLLARVREGERLRHPLRGLLPEILESFQIVDHV